MRQRKPTQEERALAAALGIIRHQRAAIMMGATPQRGQHHVVVDARQRDPRPAVIRLSEFDVQWMRASGIKVE